MHAGKSVCEVELLVSLEVIVTCLSSFTCAVKQNMVAGLTNSFKHPITRTRPLSHSNARVFTFSLKALSIN